MLHRQLGNELMVSAEISQSQPAIPLHDNVVFRFYLKLNSPYFLNYTNLALDKIGGRISYASNLASNKAGTKLNLSKAISQYDAGRQYFPGDLVSYNGNQVFESLKKSLGNTPTSPGVWRRADKVYFTSVWNTIDPYEESDLVKDAAGNIFSAKQPSKNIPLSNLNFWEEVSKVQVATQEDFIEITSGSYSLIQTELSGAFTFRICRLNSNTTLYDSEIQLPLQFTFSAAIEYVNLVGRCASVSATYDGGTGKLTATFDVSKLPHGRYKLMVNSKVYDVYVDPTIVKHGYFGVIEIFNHPALNSDYRLFNSTWNLLSPEYTVAFRNRSSIWKYITRSSAVEYFDDPNDLDPYSFDIPSPFPLEFISKVPIPLFETPNKFFSVKKGSNQFDAIKNADVKQLKQIEISGSPGTTYFCSEIFLNY